MIIFNVDYSFCRKMFAKICYNFFFSRFNYIAKGQLEIDMQIGKRLICNYQLSV